MGGSLRDDPLAGQTREQVGAIKREFYPVLQPLFE